ncbi:Hpt domain-containing protein [Massilia timonae]|nr:Hpt domain-containing protein [Massilia timonae]
MDDRPLFLRVLGRFAGDYRDLAARLHAALDAGDAVLAHRIAHTLKGAAGMIEANRLRRLALDVELALKAGGAAPLALIAALDEELARVLAEVDVLLAAPETPAQVQANSPAARDDLARLRDMLDIGDGRAPDLAAQLRPRLLAGMGSEKVAAFDAALRRFDFENALALLEQAGPR